MSSYFTRTLRNLALLGTVLVVGTGCTSMGHQREAYPDPNDRLNFMLTEYDTAIMSNSACFELEKIDHATTDCARVNREVARLYVEFPENERVLMSNAVLNFEQGNNEKAQYFLDLLLAKRGPHPEAAILSSQIALENGNSKYALEMLERQIMMAPDRADLREAQAAAYYLEGKLPQARATLGLAGRLGSPGWRLAYHHGLICEAEHNWKAACNQYELALQQKPDYVPAQSRLIGLSVYQECTSMAFASPSMNSVSEPPGSAVFAGAPSSQESEQ